MGVVVVAGGSFDWGGGCNITKSSNNARHRQHQRGMRTFECVLTRRHNGGGSGGREGAGGAHSDGGHRSAAAKERSGGAQRRPKVTRTSSPGRGSESPNRRHTRAGTLPLAFADLYPPTAANGGAGRGSMHPEIGLPIPALSPGQPG